MDIPTIPGLDIQVLLSPPDIMGMKRVLCIQPHPDDNEIGMGGIVAVLAQKGCEIHYLTVTNGDQGNRDCTATPEQTAKIRHAETIAAGRHLGASQFYFLDYGDGTLNDIGDVSAKIARVIRQAQPQAIFCPDPWLPYEGHYDHIVTGMAVSNAFHMSGRTNLDGAGDTQPWSATAIGYYFTASPNTVVDIAAVFDQKFEAMALHGSQMDAELLGMYRAYFSMKGRELTQGKSIGEGLKVLGQLHTHCFVDANRI